MWYTPYMAKGPKRKPIEERFWPKVDKRGPEDCWEWIGARQVSGYGFIYAGRNPRFLIAHRVSWELANGPIPAGLVVCHHCDDPPCCNPKHLFLGTRADNNRDRAKKKRGRESRQWGEQNPNVKVSDEQCAKMRDLYESGWSQTHIAKRFGIKQPQVSRIVRGVQRRGMSSD